MAMPPPATARPNSPPQASPAPPSEVEEGDFCLRTNPAGVDLNRNWDVPRPAFPAGVFQRRGRCVRGIYSSTVNLTIHDPQDAKPPLI